jgi:UDP-2,4-diacetamido-2,4,6-trideoxy-beta-L-altropyranose hydrolase
MTMQLRLAVEGDAAMVFTWRNSPTVRNASLDPREIAWNEHAEWFNRSLKLLDRRLLIGEADGVPVGVLRFDLGSAEAAEISIFLDPTQVGHGYGEAILDAGKVWAKQNLVTIRMLHAKVKPDNAASMRTFEKSGFKESWRLYAINL